MKTHHPILKTSLGALAALVLLALGPVAQAAEVIDYDLFQRSREIEAKLMAPCCWSGTVAEHQSGVVEEMKDYIRASLRQEKPEQEILNHFVAQYGQKILAAPPTSGGFRMFWVLPIAGILGGLSFLILMLRSWRPSGTPKAKPAVAGVAPGGPWEARLEEELRQLDRD